MVTGYWPPTNIDTPPGLLHACESSHQGSFGEYINQNFQNSGYTVIAIAPTFPGATPGQYGPGTGQWQVDYQKTSTVFWQLVRAYKPVAIMSFSLGYPGNGWLLERCVTNLQNSSWRLLWTGMSAPYIGGATNDPAAASGLPNHGRSPETGGPPDATLAANQTRSVPSSVYNPTAGTGLLVNIQNALTSHFGGTSLVPSIHNICMGDVSAGDNFVSAFMGYHAVWYQAWSGFTPACKVGFHTHVGTQCTVADSQTAFGIQFNQLVSWLNSH